jgi:UDP-glucose 4-epimerase
MSFKDKRILVTGGAGFIGSNLAIRLAAEGSEVTILDSMLPDYGGNLFNLRPVEARVCLNFSDMRDWHNLSCVVRDKDYIFNLAGQVSHQDSMTDPLMDMEINVKAQIVLLEAARRYNPGAVIVHASTRQFYGRPQYLPVDEKHPLNPPDVNGINKLAGEQYHMLYAKVYSIQTVSLRLTNTYGPRQLIKNARQGFIGWFVNRAIVGEKIQLFGTGEQVRDFNYVDDVVEAMIRAARCRECYGTAYNLSGDRASLRVIAEKLIRLTGKGSLEVIPFPEERKKIDIGDFYGSSEKFRETTGWKPEVTIDDGLARTVHYYGQHKDHYLEGP